MGYIDLCMILIILNPSTISPLSFICSKESNPRFFNTSPSFLKPYYILFCLFSKGRYILCEKLYGEILQLQLNKQYLFLAYILSGSISKSKNPICFLKHLFDVHCHLQKYFLWSLCISRCFYSVPPL